MVAALDRDGGAWLPGGGLRVTAPVQIVSAAASKIVDACVASQELTIEVWIKPASASLPNPSRPGRIVTLSKNSSTRNVSLQQGTSDQADSTHYHARLRLEDGKDEREISVVTPPNSVAAALQHVVYTRDAAGQIRLFIDGVERANGARAGKLKWDRKYTLSLANEPDGDRPWLGEYYQVAIYSQALSASEIQGNFAGRTRPAYRTKPVCR